MQLSKHQNIILQLVNVLGCLSMEQTRMIIKSFSEEPISPNAINAMVTMLIKNNYLDLLSDSYLVEPGSTRSYSVETISCVWAMLAIVSNPDDILSVMKTAKPSSFYFLHNNKNAFEVVYITEDRLVNLHAIEEKVMSRNEKAKGKYNPYFLFVVDSEERIKDIKDYKFNFPFVIALVKPNKKDIKPANIKMFKGGTKKTV